MVDSLTRDARAARPDRAPCRCDRRSAGAKKALIFLALSALLSACSALSARGTPPILVLEAKAPIERAAACLVRAFDDALKSPFPGDGAITHGIFWIDPGARLEVAPRQTITIGAEIYFAVVTARGPAQSRIELFANGSFVAPLSAAARGCAGQFSAKQ